MAKSTLGIFMFLVSAASAQASAVSCQGKQTYPVEATSTAPAAVSETLYTLDLNGTGPGKIDLIKFRVVVGGPDSNSKSDSPPAKDVPSLSGFKPGDSVETYSFDAKIAVQHVNLTLELPTNAFELPVGSNFAGRITTLGVALNCNVSGK